MHRYKVVLALALVLVAALAAACTREVIKEVEVEKPVIVEKEVIKEVEVEKPVIVEKEVIKEVEVEKIVEVEGVTEKVLRVRMANMSPQFAPHIQARGDMAQIGSWIWSRLAQANPQTGQWAPDLAERWDLAEDFSSMTFYLRKNALWHDGEPVTAEDVAYTVRTFLHPDESSWMLATFHAVKGGKDYQQGNASWPIPGVQIIDDHTIKLEFETASAFFLDDLNNLCGLAPVPVLPAHILADVPDDELFEHEYFSKDMIGSGPWKFVQYIPDQFLEMEAFDEFYFGRPGIDKIIMAIIPSPDATQIAMQRGEIDTNVRGGVTREAEEAFLRDPRFDVWATMGQNAGGLGSFNMRRSEKGINNPLLHQAWAQAIDKDTLFLTFARGLGKKVWTPLVHSWYYKDEWSDLYPFDPAASKMHLAEMDYDTNQTLEVMIGPSRSEDETANRAARQQYLADVGIKIEFDTVDTAISVARFYEQKDYEVTFGGGGGTQGGPAQYLGGRWISCGNQLDNPSCDPWGYAEYKKPEWDELVFAGMQITDRAEAAAHWQMVNEEYLLKDLPIVGSWVGAGVKIKNKRFYMPIYGDIPAPDRMSDIKVFPIHIGRDDNWSFHPEQWEIR